MNPDPSSQELLDLLAQARPQPVPAPLMERLRRAEPADPDKIIPLPDTGPAPWSRRRMWTMVAAAACGMAAALALWMHAPAPSGSDPVVTVSPPEAKPTVDVSNNRKWIYAREVGTGVGEDGQPFRMVEGRWIDCSHIRIAGNPKVWTTVTPGEGIVRTSMPVY